MRVFISNKSVNINSVIKSISWSGDKYQCARTLELEIIASFLNKNIPAVPCELGSKVVLLQGKTVLFDGFIFERRKTTGSNIIVITCYDRGIYIKRNEGTYSFVNSPVTPEAITEKICKDFGIGIGNIKATGIKVNRNFIGVSLYNIIQTAYNLAADQTKKQYMIRFEGEKLSVIEKGISKDTRTIEGRMNLMSATVRESISNMINQVAIYNSEDKLVGIHRNEQAIQSYGLMQGHLRRTDKEEMTARAKKVLEENGEEQKITVENIGHTANITGESVVIREPYTGLYGLFYIDSDIHTWKLGQYYNRLTLDFKNIIDR